MTTTSQHPSCTTSTPASERSFFATKKARILQDLAVPITSYHDKSPKDSIDVNIRDLIDEINSYDGYVTTSSCAGRISVFLEGAKRPTWKARDDSEPQYSGNSTIGEESELKNGSSIPLEKSLNSETGSVIHDSSVRLAAVGGKGGGGRWLFVSHDKIPKEDYESAVITFLGMNEQEDNQAISDDFDGHRLIHFKFEPLILHILTASSYHAQVLLSAAMQAGFRESGAMNLVASQEVIAPMVGIRSMGLGLESVIGCLDSHGNETCIVSPSYLKGLLSLADARFEENTRRICRFRNLLKVSVNKPFDTTDAGPGKHQKSDGRKWENATARRERKRAEGLKRAQELHQQAQQNPSLQQLGGDHGTLDISHLQDFQDHSV